MMVFEGVEYLTRQEFANEIGVSYVSVRNYDLKGILKPALKIGRSCLYSKEQVEAYFRGEYFPVIKRG